jgi:hypothetical protein
LGFLLGLGFCSLALLSVERELAVGGGCWLGSGWIGSLGIGALGAFGIVAVGGGIDEIGNLGIGAIGDMGLEAFLQDHDTRLRPTFKVGRRPWPLEVLGWLGCTGM